MCVLQPPVVCHTGLFQVFARLAERAHDAHERAPVQPRQFAAHKVPEALLYPRLGDQQHHSIVPCGDAIDLFLRVVVDPPSQPPCHAVEPLKVLRLRRAKLLCAQLVEPVLDHHLHLRQRLKGRHVYGVSRLLVALWNLLGV
eukprot:4967571-Prymnesium_polylepis.1